MTVVTCAPNFPEGRLLQGYENRWYQTESMSGIRVVRVKTYVAPNRGVVRRSLDFASFMLSGCIGGLLQPRPDVVAATSPQFLAAVAAWAVGRVRRIPFVFELGDLWPASIDAVGAVRRTGVLRLIERLELRLYRDSASIVALTNHFKANLVARGIDGAKIAVVRNGVDTWRYGPRARDASLAGEWKLGDRFVVGYVGTHGMAHGLGNVLDAAERLADAPELSILLVGAGAERARLIDEARDRCLGNVVFMPPQPKHRMPAVWSLCDVALVHLRNAPLFAGVIPSKIFEAMAMGLPVLLAAPPGEALDVVADAGAGLWVPADDPGELADACRRLMSDTALRRTLAENSLKAAPRHSRRRQAREVLDVLEMVRAGLGDETGLRERSAPAPPAPAA